MKKSLSNLLERITFLNVSLSLLLLSTILLCFSCKRDSAVIETKMNTPAVISILPQKETIPFSELFSDYRIIDLDDSVTLSQILKVELISDETHDERWLIYGRSGNSRLFLFDARGDFIQSIGRIGRGPGEYGSLRNLNVSKMNTLDVLAYERSKLIQYSLEDGNMIQEISIPRKYIPEDFERISEDQYIFFQKHPQGMDNKHYQILNYSTKDTSITFRSSETDPILVNYLFFMEMNNLYYFRDTIRFYTGFKDTIYNVFPDHISPRFVFDYGDYKIKEEILYNKEYGSVMDFAKACRSSKCIWDINRLYETDGGLFFTYRFEDDFYFAFYNKKSGQVISSDRFHDDMIRFREDKGTSLILPEGSTQNSFIFKISANDFLNSIDTLKQSLSQNQWDEFTQENKRIADLYSKTQIEDNDLLVQFFLKNE